jgi:two-component system response regulator FixJ
MNETFPSISIIDQNEAPRQSIAFLLRTAGYSPRAYVSLSEFCAHNDPEETTLIVFDAPGLDQGNAFEDARLRGCMRKHRTIIMSATPDPTLVNAAFRCGAIDFVFKPFPKKRLIDTIHAARMGRNDPIVPNSKKLERLSTQQAKISKTLAN